jgi:hypothetical protein
MSGNEGHILWNFLLVTFLSLPLTGVTPSKNIFTGFFEKHYRLRKKVGLSGWRCPVHLQDPEN